MNFKNKHSKMLKALEQVSYKNFIEELSSLEYALQNSIDESEIALVPQEANFQLPNVFLKTKLNAKVEKLFKETPPAKDCDEALDSAIEFLSEIEIKDPVEINENRCFSEAILEKLIRARFGSKK